MDRRALWEEQKRLFEEQRKIIEGYHRIFRVYADNFPFSLNNPRNRGLLLEIILQMGGAAELIKEYMAKN